MGTGVAVGMVVGWATGGSASELPRRGGSIGGGTDLPRGDDTGRGRDYDSPSSGLPPPEVQESDRTVDDKAGLTAVRKRPRSTLGAGSDQRRSIGNARRNAGEGATEADEAAKAATKAAEMQRAAAEAARDVGSTITQSAAGLSQRLAGLSPAERDAVLNERLKPRDDLSEVYEKAGLKTNRDLLDQSEKFSKNLEKGAEYHQKKADDYEKQAREAEQAARDLKAQEAKLARAGTNLGTLHDNGTTLGKKNAPEEQALKKALEEQLAKELIDKGAAAKGSSGQGNEASLSSISKEQTAYPLAIPFAEKIAPTAGEQALRDALDGKGAQKGAEGKGAEKGAEGKNGKKSKEGEEDEIEEELANAGVGTKDQMLLGMVKLAGTKNPDGSVRGLAGNHTSEPGEGGAAGADEHFAQSGNSQTQTMTIFKRVSLAIERCQLKHLDCVQ